MERAAEEPTGAPAEACAPKGTHRWRPSGVPCRTWKRPQKRSRPWMRSFPGCEARASPPLGGRGDLVRFFNLDWEGMRKRHIRRSAMSRMGRLCAALGRLHQIRFPPQFPVLLLDRQKKGLGWIV